MKRSVPFLFLFLIFLAPQHSYAVSSIDVSLDDPAYHHLEVLEAHGLIKTAVMGQRPWSRMEVGRLLIEARENRERLGVEREAKNPKEEWVGKILGELEKEFSREVEICRKKAEGLGGLRRLELHALDRTDLLITFLDSNAKMFPNNGLGGMTARSQPLVQNRQGRDYTDGSQYSLETVHWVDATPFLSFYLQPRFQFQFPTGRDDDPGTQPFVQEFYSVVNLWGVEIQAGRSTLIQGQGPHGGLVLSDHARPLDHVHVTNDHPVVLPWVFKYLGGNKLTLYFGTLGPESFFPNTLHVGYKWSIKPFDIWELGLANTMVIGGDGSPDFSALEFLGDFLGFSGTGESKSNRLIGLDTRLRLPFLRNVQLYGEALWDDKTIQNWKRTLVDTVAYEGGIFIPRIDDAGRWHGRIEFRYISELMYRHGQFQSGYTLNREILGDPQGPDSHGLSVHLGWDIQPRTRAGFDGYYVVADGDVYTNTGGEIFVNADNQAETRIRGILTFSKGHRRYNFLGRFGYERVQDFNYVAGDNRHHFLAEAGIRVDLGDKLTLIH